MSTQREGVSVRKALSDIDEDNYESAPDAIRAALANVGVWQCPDCPSDRYTRPTRCSECGADGDRFEKGVRQ